MILEVKRRETEEESEPEISKAKRKAAKEEPELESSKAKRKADEEEPEPEPLKAKAKRKKSPLELLEEFINEIKNDEKNINELIFKEYFFYQTPLFLAKELHNSNRNINDEIVKHVNDALVALKKDINIKQIPENENANRIVNIVEKILDFNKQQKGKGLLSDLAKHTKILTPKQMI